MTQYIRNSNNKIIGILSTHNGKTILREFTTNKIVSHYDAHSDTTTDYKSNTQLKGNQAIRFLK